MDEQTRAALAEEEALGRQALMLEHNPIWAAILDKQKADLYLEWISTKTHETQQRENIWARVRAIIDLEGELQTAIVSGMDAEQRLEEADKKQE